MLIKVVTRLELCESEVTVVKTYHMNRCEKDCEQPYC